MTNILSNTNGWILTDDNDSYQHVKNTKDDCYAVIQIYYHPGSERYYVGVTEVDVSEYITTTDEDFAQIVIDLLSGYGYDTFILGEDYETTVEHMQLIVNHIKEIYGDNYYKQIIAECITEDAYEPDDFVIHPKESVRWKQAKTVVDNYMQNH